MTINEALRKAVEAYKSGDVAAAKRLFSSIIQIEPNQPDANNNMGAILVASGDLEEALPFIKTALEANFSVAQYWFNYIDVLFKLDRFSEALELLAVARNKGCKGQAFDELEERLGSTAIKFEIQIESFLKLIDQGEIAKVLEVSEQLLREIPDSLSLLNVVCLANEKSGNFNAAVDNYKQILKIVPNSPEAYNNMGNALKDQGKLEEAIAAYNKTLSIKPDYAEAYYNMGNALKEQGKLEEAIEAYNKALAIKPDFSEAHYNMGIVLAGQGKPEEAIEAYNKALAVKPDYAEAHYNMGIALADQGKQEEAIEAYNKALAIKPDYAEAHYNMGNALKDQDKLDEAIAAYNKTLAIKPDYAEAHMNLSYVKRSAVPSWHIPMMNEHGRNEAYQKAMNSAIREGDVVLDIGTGSGLLSMIAADCGAKEIITCEMSKTISEVAEKIIQKNGFDHIIRVINKNSKDLILGQDINKKVDVLVSEILSSEFVGEGIQASLLDAKKRLLKKTGKMIPEGGNIMIALIENTGKLAEELFAEKALGYDISDFNSITTNMMTPMLKDEPVFLSDPIEAFTFDFRNFENLYRDTKTLKIKVNKTGVCAGVIQWLKVQLYDDIEYQNNPVEMHRLNSVSGWKTPIFKFNDPVNVTKGQSLDIQATLDGDYSWFHLDRFEIP